jgi:hypothetical protein
MLTQCERCLLLRRYGNGLLKSSTHYLEEEMPMRPRTQLSNIGIILIMLISSTLGHAHKTTGMHLKRSELAAMDNPVTDVQRNAIMSVLHEAMRVLGGNTPLKQDDPRLGRIRWVKKSPFSEYGDIYSFDNDSMPEAEIKIRTIDDPQDDSDDRAKVRIVPASFELYFYVDVRGVTPSMLKEQLDLADYWIDGDGEQHQYNDMGPGIPPMLGLHRYRYRANARSDSEFPVDVELSYGDGPENTRSGTLPSLGIVDIRRAYPYVTPQMREKKQYGVAPDPHTNQTFPAK